MNMLARDIDNATAMRDEIDWSLMRHLSRELNLWEDDCLCYLTDDAARYFQSLSPEEMWTAWIFVIEELSGLDRAIAPSDISEAILLYESYQLKGEQWR